MRNVRGPSQGISQETHAPSSARLARSRDLCYLRLPDRHRGAEVVRGVRRANRRIQAADEEGRVSAGFMLPDNFAHLTHFFQRWR